MIMNTPKKDFFLESPSGFMMPFLPDDGSEVEISLDYGEQIHPNTGQKFFHHGVDFVCSRQPLLACASGTVIAAGEDASHGNFLITRYGKYEVKYGHLEKSFAPYGTKVAAGDQIAVSGDFLHMGVTLEGQDIDPKEFLASLLSNVTLLASMGIQGSPRLVEYNIPTRNGYEADQEHINSLLQQYLVQYVNELQAGTYRPLEQTETSLRNIFRQGIDKNYFFESVPSLGNPMGMGERSAPFIGKVQSLLIGDFLAFMAQRYGHYVPTWGDEQKKNLLTRFRPEVIL